MRLAGLTHYADLTLLAQLGETLVIRAAAEDGRSVIIKTHASDLPTTDSRDRFRREHQLTRAAANTGLANVVELIDQPTRSALVLDDPGPHTLAERCSDGKLDLLGVVDIAVDVAAALTALHAEGIVHRSVDADHIAVTEVGPVLIDFYDACPVGGRPRRDTHGAHAAPEQMGTARPPAVAATDQFALGATISRALDLLGLDPPVALAAILDQLAQPDPRARYRSMLGVLADLESVRDQMHESGDAAAMSLSIDSPRLAWEDPRHLVGRARVLDELRGHVDAVASQRTVRVIVIRSPSGLGRSSIVTHFCDDLAERAILSGLGRFVNGGPALPLQAPLEMMEQVVALLLAAPNDTIDRVRNELVSRLGPDLPLAAQVIPAVRHLIDRQPDPAMTDPEETVARVERVVRATVAAIADVMPPLVAVFDDGDRADVTSLQTFEMLAGHREMGPLVVVITVGHDAGRIDPVLDRLRARGVDVRQIDLDPLEAADIRELVAVGTGDDPDRLAPVADAIWARSGGSPTLALADLWQLTEGGHLRIDLGVRSWVWDEVAISRGDPLTIDAVAQRRIDELDPGLQQLVLATALAGRSATDELLATWLDEPIELVARLVDRCVSARVLSRVQGDRIVCLDNGTRRAALELLASPVRDQLRYDLARAMLTVLPGDHDGHPVVDDEQRFTLIDLLRGQPSLLHDAADRALFIHLSREAARTAHRNAAFQESLDLQLAALAVARGGDVQSDPDEVFELLLHAAEHAIMVGQTTLTDDLLAEMDLPNRSAHQRVRGMRVLGTRVWTRGDLDSGLDTLRSILDELGEPVPHPVTWADLAREYVSCRRSLGTAAPESFLAASQLDDARVRAAFDAMLACVHLAYVDQPMTHIWLVLRGTRLTAEHGVSDASSYFLTAYGMLRLSTPLGMRTGLRFGDVGRELSRNVPRPTQTLVGFAHEAFVRHWGEPLADTIDPMLDTARSAVANGERGYGLTGGTFAVLHGLLASRPLRSVDAEAVELANDLEEMGEQAFRTRVQVVRQAVHDLRMGGSAAPLCGDEFDLDTWMAGRARSSELAMIVQTVRGLVAMCFGDRATLVEATAAAARLTRTAPGQAALGRHWFHVAYLDADRVGVASASIRRVASLANAERSLQRLRKFAEHAPANVSHRVALIEAMLAERRPTSIGRARAMDRYERAVALATANGALHDLGVAAERAARFHAAHDRPALARHYALTAREAWEAWGAAAVAGSLAARMPDSINLRPTTIRAPGSPAISTAADVSDPTSETLAEASSLLGQELEVRDFLQRLIEILMRHTGASRGFLVLQSASGPMVEVTGQLVGGAVQVAPLASSDLGSHPDLCIPAVNYVLRTRQVLSVIDPAADRRFRADPDLRSRAPRALLGLPVGRSNATSGVLVLESDTFSHAFEPERIEALRVLSAQAISAIDQARLSSDLTILSDDVAELRETASALTERAETDSLTGVANRAGLESRLQTAIRSAQSAAAGGLPPDAQVGVLFCDLDDFKLVNDHFGHAVGDAVLVEIATRLRTATRTDDIVARVGGDEFVVVSVGVSPGELERMAERAVTEIARAVEVEPHGVVTVSTSIGVGRADLGEITTLGDVDALVSAADTAMYQAKNAGKNRVHRSPG